MNADQVFSWILTHSSNYPGKHQVSQPRTNDAFKPLEPKSQLHIVFKSLSEYIKENLNNGKSVNVKGFGAFSFEINSDFVKPAIHTTIDFRKTLDQIRDERKHVHKLRPCFVADTQFKNVLSRYNNKEELSTSKSQNTVYQQGFGMIFCNPTPIAAASYLGKEVVVSALQAITTAIIDLTRLGYDLNLDFGFCRVIVNNKNLTYRYTQEMGATLNDKSFENTMKKSLTNTKSLWTSTYQEKWGASTLSGLYKVPNPKEVYNMSNKTLALKIMSLDMNSTEKTVDSRKHAALPKINADRSHSVRK